MGRIIATESITLDGVMQAPGRPDEDMRGDFRHGGWAIPYADQVAVQFMSVGMGAGGAILFGRHSYEDVLHHWSTATKPNPFTELLINTPKFVVSRSADTRLEYPSSTLLAGEDVDSPGHRHQALCSRHTQ